MLVNCKLMRTVPDPAYHFDVDPDADPGYQNNADPCRSRFGSTTLPPTTEGLTDGTGYRKMYGTVMF
jgi:hypothetical protein